MALPAASHSCFLSALNAGLEELYGKLIPKASIADAIVFAVYIPPQAPAPGHACFMIPLKSSGEIALFIFLPKASKAETMFNCSPFQFPGAIVPPYTMIAGRFNLPIAINEPGMFLSQPITAINPS